MITGTLMAVALLLGYLLTVGLSLVATFGLTSASPEFAVQNYKVTAKYKRVQALVWLLCVTAGAVVTSAVAQGAHPILLGTVMAATFIGMLWWNTWEARQRGMAHQILMSLVSIVGIVLGYGLAGRFLKF